jgi:SAM-dependent methyltransferase
MKSCPGCDSSEVVVTITRSEIPVLQNVVYSTPSLARAAVCGAFALATCTRCGFSYNARFDFELIHYDESYDNHVASNVFNEYYRDLARQLNSTLNLSGGLVYEVGCGKGEFLKTLCREDASVRAVGIDPSCTPEVGTNYELCRAEFSREAFAQGEATKLVLLRHVLEHIERPLEFLRSLRHAIPLAPLYVEVPDLNWILENNAFWDFCYEHCNYFTSRSLLEILARAGFRAMDHGTSFGGQYLWVLAMPDESMATLGGDPIALQATQDYARREGALLKATQEKAMSGSGLILWGMATKGVMLANILPEGAVLGGVDMNPKKQGQYCARRATPIRGPSWVGELPAGSRIMVMNPNYLEEVRTSVAPFGSDLSVQPI